MIAEEVKCGSSSAGKEESPYYAGIRLLNSDPAKILGYHFFVKSVSSGARNVTPEMANAS